MSSKRQSKSITVGDLRARMKRQLNRSLRDVERTSSVADESIHQIRLRCKRLRAYLQLLSRYDKQAVKPIARCVREAARSLSTLRDRQVIPRAIDQARDQLVDHAMDLDHHDLQQLCQALKPMVSAPIDSVDASLLSIKLATVTKQLCKAKRRLRKTKRFDAKILDASALCAGYDQCRREISRCRIAGSATSFHELRKAVKSHLYQCQLFKSIHQAKIRSRCQRLKTLAELLGSAHDLTIANSAIESSASKADLETATKAWLRIGQALDSQALAIGLELFFDDHECFLRILTKPE